MKTARESVDRASGRSDRPSARAAAVRLLWAGLLLLMQPPHLAAAGFLDFALPGLNPYNALVTSVFDHHLQGMDAVEIPGNLVDVKGSVNSIDNFSSRDTVRLM